MSRVLADAARALREGRRSDAEALLLPHLRANPDDPGALALLAESAMLAGAHLQSERFARQALTIAPAHPAALWTLARTLRLQDRPAEVVATVDRLLEGGPHLNLLMLKAAALDQLGDHDAAIAIHEAQFARDDGHAAVWLSYGHVLRTARRTVGAIAAWRRALALDPQTGEAWWSLACVNAIEPDDLPAIEAGLASARDPVEAAWFRFALARAHEDAGRHEEAFGHYAEGNRLRRQTLAYDARAFSDEIRRAEALYTRDFFAARAGQGARDPAPIFVVGMPRSGSTLVEQVLDSHSMIEGTSELLHIPALVRQLIEERWNDRDARYPELVADLGPERLHALGEAYLERVRPHRRTARPFFVDKLPHNWTDVGLIHLILPHARIVDVRRDAIDCCFSNYRHCFGKGHPASYALDEMGLYYRDYVRLMDHFEAVLPGRVHRVVHGAMIADPEAEIRRLLDGLGLPFEPACLDFHRNPRAVRTASAEQVGRPINRDGVGAWRPFAHRLGPLRAALGM